MATRLRELIASVSADTTKYQREMKRASCVGSQCFRTVREGGADASRGWEIKPRPLVPIPMLLRQFRRRSVATRLSLPEPSA